MCARVFECADFGLSYLSCRLLIIRRHIIAFSASFSNLAKERQKSINFLILSLCLHILSCCCLCRYIFSVVSFAAQRQFDRPSMYAVFTEIFHISSRPAIGTLLLHSRHIVKCWIVNNTRAFAIFAFHHLFYKSWLCAEFAIFIFCFFFFLCPFRVRVRFLILSLRLYAFALKPIPFGIWVFVVVGFFFIDAAFPLLALTLLIFRVNISITT